MAYLGRQPIVGNYQVLDALTATTTDTYALTKNSVAVFPQTPANCIVSLNGVIQAPYDSYTISGSNIVFASALTASDSIDFITVLGDVLNVGTVSDGTIGISKLSATGTPSSSTFLRGDNSWVSAGGTNTPAFAAYKNSDVILSDNVETKLTWDTELFDTHNAFSSDRFTCPSGGAGKYQFNVYARLTVASTSIAWVYLVFKKNGNYVHSGTVPYNDFTNNYIAAFTPSQSNIITLAENDYVEAFIAADLTVASGILNTTANEFSGYKLIE